MIYAKSAREVPVVLRDEILAYTDADGLVSPQATQPNQNNASDNGVLFTSDYYVLLARLGQLNDVDYINYSSLIRKKCTTMVGLLNRGPDNTNQEAPDDYYGLFSACQSLGLEILPSQIIQYGWDNWGNYNNVNPGKFTWVSFLARQPQLICAAYAAARSAPLWIYPLRVYTAIVIATSCINAPVGDTTSRRLAYHLINTMSPVSEICRIAAKIWFRRLLKDYPNGMQGVNDIYFGPDHPLAKYMVKY